MMMMKANQQKATRIPEEELLPVSLGPKDKFCFESPFFSNMCTLTTQPFKNSQGLKAFEHTYFH